MASDLIGSMPTRITACFTSRTVLPSGLSATELARRITLADSSGSATTILASASSPRSGFSTAFITRRLASTLVGKLSSPIVVSSSARRRASAALCVASLMLQLLPEIQTAF